MGWVPRPDDLRPAELRPVELLLDALKRGVADRAVGPQRHETSPLCFGRGTHDRRVVVPAGVGRWRRGFGPIGRGAVRARAIPRDLLLRTTQLELAPVPHELHRLGALLARTHHGFDPERFLAATPQTEQAYASFLGTQLEEPNVVILVAERDGEVLGYTYAGVEGHDYMALRGPAGVLHDIVVDPAHRGHGIGRELLDATLAALEARARPGSCCGRRSGTSPRSACSPARGSGGR